jgi:hypothetical protein
MKQTTITDKKSGAKITAALLIVLSLHSFAGDQPAPKLEASKQGLADLTFSNFFSAGWDEGWTRRSRGEDAPDMALLRVQTNFLTDVFRLDYGYQENPKTSSVRASDAFTGTLEYAFNRRIELGLVGYYNWVDYRTGENREGATEGAFVRLQWVDTATSSLATTLRVALPNHDLGGKDTTVSLAVTGWQDISVLGVKRLGLYYHVQEELLSGPIASGARRNDLTYDISLAKTWTSPDSFLGNASTFVEFYGITDLDGTKRSQTILSVTPGVRATIAKRHIIMAGVEFPLTEPNPYERIVRLTYIYNF